MNQQPGRRRAIFAQKVRDASATKLVAHYAKHGNALTLDESYLTLHDVIAEVQKDSKPPRRKLTVKS